MLSTLSLKRRFSLAILSWSSYLFNSVAIWPSCFLIRNSCPCSFSSIRYYKLSRALLSCSIYESFQSFSWICSLSSSLWSIIFYWISGSSTSCSSNSSIQFFRSFTCRDNSIYISLFVSISFVKAEIFSEDYLLLSPFVVSFYYNSFTRLSFSTNSSCDSYNS